jgi:hypothetical protein
VLGGSAQSQTHATLDSTTLVSRTPRSHNQQRRQPRALREKSTSSEGTRPANKERRKPKSRRRPAPHGHTGQTTERHGDTRANARGTARAESQRQAAPHYGMSVWRGPPLSARDRKRISHPRQAAPFGKLTRTALLRQAAPHRKIDEGDESLSVQEQQLQRRAHRTTPCFSACVSMCVGRSFEAKEGDHRLR